MIDKTGRLDEIHHALVHVSGIFPADTDLTCTFTAAAGADTWSAYIEIVDSGATTLSAAFATDHGHITGLTIEEVSEANTIYEVEFSWGAGHMVVMRSRFAGGTKFQAPEMVQRMAAPNFPAGQTVYYRMKTATGVADTCLVHMRYHTDP